MKNRTSLLMVACLIILARDYTNSATAQAQGQQGIRSPRPEGGPSRIGATPESAATVPPIDGVTALGNGEYAISGPRPLEQAAQFLERKLGVPIWYEDPPWTFSGDLVEAADLPSNRELAARYPRWRGPLVPRGGTLTVRLPRTEADFKAENPMTLPRHQCKAFGQFWGGPEKSRRLTIGANNEIAREVLARAMRTTGGTKVSWGLTYMPHIKTYLLGLSPVEVEVPMPGAEVQLKTIYWPKQ